MKVSEIMFFVFWAIITSQMIQNGAPRPFPETRIITFWQISDIHLDKFYSVNGNPDDWCHEHVSKNNYNKDTINNNNTSKNYSGNSNNYNISSSNMSNHAMVPKTTSMGKYGVYECEANWDLVMSAFEFMTKEQPIPGAG